jgi:hypothetical protein
MLSARYGRLPAFHGAGLFASRRESLLAGAVLQVGLRAGVGVEHPRQGGQASGLQR